MRRLLTNASFTFLVPILSLAFQLVVDVLVARRLGPELLGEMAFAFSLAGLLSIFLLFGTGEIAIQRYVERDTPPERVFSSMLTLLGAGTLVCLTLATLLCHNLELSRVTWVAVLMVLATLVLNGASSLCNHAIIAFDLSRRDVSTVLISRLVLITSVLLTLPSGDLGWILGSFVLAALVQLVARAQLVHRHAFELRWDWCPETTMELWRRGRHIGLGSVFGTAANRADTLAIRHLAGAYATGLYGAAYRFITGLQAISSALSLALFPWLRRAQGRWLRRLFLALGVFPALALIVIAFTLPEFLIWLAYGDAFAPAAQVLRWLLLASAFQWMHAFASRWWIAQGREHVLPRAQAAGALIGLTTLLALIPRYGALGAAWATLAGDVVGLCVLQWLATRSAHADPADS